MSRSRRVRLAAAVTVLLLPVGACADPRGSPTAGPLDDGAATATADAGPTRPGSAPAGPSPAASTPTTRTRATSDAAWVAATCSALGRWLADADRDEDSMRALALDGTAEPADVRRKALAVVDASTVRTVDLRGRLGSTGSPEDADLVALAAETDRVLAETVDVLERVRPRIAALPVEDDRLFARAAGPVVGEVLLGEARLVGELTSAVVAARESGAGRLFAETSECRSLHDGLRLAPW